MKTKFYFLLSWCMIMFISCTEDIEPQFGQVAQDENGFIAKKAKPYKVTLRTDSGEQYLMGTGETPKVDYDADLKGDRFYIIGSLGGEPEYEFDENSGKLSVPYPTINYYEGTFGPSYHNLYYTIPGKWSFQVVAIHEKKENNRVCYVAYESEVKEILVKFPDVYQMRDELKDHMKSVWEEAIAQTNEKYSVQKGFWIYAVIQTENLKIEYGPTESEYYSPCDNWDRVNPGRPDIKIPIESWGYAKYPIGYFHTHTPLTYCTSDVERETGFSTADEAWQDGNETPILVYDYTSRITSGHDIHESADLYVSYDCYMRKLPTTWGELEKVY